MVDNNVHDKYFPPKNEKFPQIYAYRLKSQMDEIKVGFTTKKDVRDRIHEQLSTSNQDYILEFFAPAVKENGDFFDDHPVHKILEDRGAIRIPRKEVFKKKGGKAPEIFANCTKEDVKAAVMTIVTGKDVYASRTSTYGLRDEQLEAMNKTIEYFRYQKLIDPTKAPKFLWNAKMRFGKTFTALEMARRMNLSRILIITFKVEVKESWKNELNGHINFDGWQFIDIKNKNVEDTINKSMPYVTFGSFQDILGKNAFGGLKAKNKWVHETKWDLIIFDEYHYGSWRERNKEYIDDGEEKCMRLLEENILPISTNYILFLSGTPFRAINTGEFLEDQIYNWTYSDEQEAKFNWDNNKGYNPYASMPEMILMTYQLPEACIQNSINAGNNEFDLNEFFKAYCPKLQNGDDDVEKASFVHENEVQRWLDIIRGKADISNELQKTMGASKPVLPFYDVNLTNSLNHTLWYMYSVASCYAMRNLLKKDINGFYHDYEIIVAAGKKAGSGAEALKPVRRAMYKNNKTITITCGKLTTGVTIRQLSGIFMLSNISTPEAYFQSCFRVQSAWTVQSDEYNMPPEILKPKCYVFDFAPNRALKLVSEYACELSPDRKESAEQKVRDFINFLPVLAFDGTGMYPVNATEILDFVASGTTATLLARKWDSALLINVTNDILKVVINNKEALDAIMKIEGFRSLGDNVLETIINRSDKLKKRKAAGNKNDDNEKEKKEIDKEKKEIQDLRGEVQKKLMQFATRIPLFMYLTDEREICLQDVITKVEPALFKKVTGITVSDFEMLVNIGVFNSSAMNEAVAAFRRYEESSLTYTGIDKHYGEKVGLWDISVKRGELTSM